MNPGAVLLLDKPVGLTSFDVVRQIKKIYPGEKVGHAGSLDPFATGLLLVLIGTATKFSDWLMSSDKSYLATVKLGSETDTLDWTGKIRLEAPVPEISIETVEASLNSFLGGWEQTPPMFSAKKKNGVKLYELARQNITIPREKVLVRIESLNCVDWNQTQLIFQVRCSKGTYVRVLGQEIAQKLGTVGHLTALRRLQSGSFRVEEALSLEAIQNAPEEARQQGYRRFMQVYAEQGSQKGRDQKVEIPQLPRGVINDNPTSQNRMY
ncbi:tRNA pseudouridine(55) synthase TruB [bacterium]|nr:tRNA pseudouridine(55) synthase TruB [bacterium]